MAEPILETNDLTRSFGEILAVDRLNLNVAAGEVFGLPGPNIAGFGWSLRIAKNPFHPDSLSLFLFACPPGID